MPSNRLSSLPSGIALNLPVSRPPNHKNHQATAKPISVWQRAKQLPLQLVAVAGLCLLQLDHAVQAEESDFPLAGGDWSHELGGEWRGFRKDGADGQEKRGASFTYLGEYYKSWDAASFTFKPYVRWDQNDSERTHYDIRELYWDYSSDSWEVAIGFNKVYWGRLEFSNIVDVINQDDSVDNQDEKLGQPMIKFSWENDEGILDLYVLTGFRERTFPGPDGRLRTPLPVDTDAARFDDDGAIYGLDFAVRWMQMVGDYTEVAISHFSGMGREPSFSFNFDFANPMFIPVYEQIDQTGFEAEWIYEGWAVKFEALSVSGQGDRYSILAGGVEYTFGDIMSSGHDITMIIENIHDSREGNSPSFLERDIALGFRWAANDEPGTEALGGMLYDPETEEKFALLEGSRRFGENWKVFMRANVVLERSQREFSGTTLDALQGLADSELFGDVAGSDEFKVFLVDVILSGDALDLILSPDEFVGSVPETLQQLSDQTRKLNALENDDYFEVQVVRFF